MFSLTVQDAAWDLKSRRKTLAKTLKFVQKASPKGALERKVYLLANG